MLFRLYIFPKSNDSSIGDIRKNCVTVSKIHTLRLHYVTVEEFLFFPLFVKLYRSIRVISDEDIVDIPNI